MNAKAKVVYKISLIVLWLIIIEVISYILLLHLSLDGSFQKNSTVLLNIKHYIINPQSETAQPIYYPQHTVGWINNPLYKINEQLQNNSMGYRGGEIEILPGKDTIRIICMGGSTTYGYGVDHPDSSYPSFLEKELLLKYPKKKIEVINAGINASSSIEEIMNYQFKLRYLKPNIVIIKSGGNDAANQYDRQETYSPDMANVHQSYIHIPSVNPKLRILFHSNFLSLINIYINYIGLHNNMAAKHGIISRNLLSESSLWFDKDLDYALSDKYYYNFYNNFDVLTDLFIRDSVQFYALPFIINPHITNDKEYIRLNNINNEIMKSITSRKNGTWIPIYETHIPIKGWIGDDCHFNSQGNKICGKIVADYISLQ